MTDHTGSEGVREAVGVFFDVKSLREAIGDLRASGFDRTELGLLASEDTVSRRLGDLYDQVNQFSEEPHAPRIAFVEKESSEDVMHGGVGALSFAAITAAGGAVVATAGVLGGGILAAAAGFAAIGAISAVLGALINENDAEHLEDQINEGHVLLFVRTSEPAKEKTATDILSRHSGYDVRIYEVPGSAAD